MQPEDVGSAYNLERTIEAFRTSVVCSPLGEYAVMLLFHTKARRVEAAMFDEHELCGLLDLLVQESGYIGGDYLRTVLKHMGELETEYSKKLVKYGEV